MSDNENQNSSLFQCDKCSYKSKYKQNYLRHCKTHIKNPSKKKIIETKKLLEIGNQKQNEIIDKSNDDDENDDDEPEIELEDYINEKVKKILSKNNLPPVKLNKSYLRSIFNGNIPSFFIGSFVGYVLSNYIPMLLMGLQKKTISQIIPPPPPMDSKTNLNSTPSAPLTEA